MDNTVIITIEKEYAEELLSAVKSVIKHDNKENFLTADEFETLSNLEETLFIKIGG